MVECGKDGSMNYMDKMMLIKQYNEWIVNIRTETGIRSRRDLETFIDFLCERGLLKEGEKKDA